MHKSAEVKSNDCTSADSYLLDNFRNDQKNNRAKAIRFSTLEMICRELDCSVGDILEYVKDEASD